MSVNWQPQNGAPVYWVWPGGGSTGKTTRFNNTGTEFPNEPHEHEARYGKAPILPGTGVDGVPAVHAHAPVYAEAIGYLNQAMHEASLDPANTWHLSPGWPTELEVLDFAFTQCPGGWLNSAIRRYHPSSQPQPKPPKPTPEPPQPEPEPPKPQEPAFVEFQFSNAALATANEIEKWLPSTRQQQRRRARELAQEINEANARGLFVRKA